MEHVYEQLSRHPGLPQTIGMDTATKFVRLAASVATAQPGLLTAWLRVLGHIFGDGPGADQTAYGLERL
jgi:hypothetical protein